MLSFRGDAHKVYLQLRKKASSSESFLQIKDLDEIDEIVNFYRSLDRQTLKKVYYRMIKEKNGSGIIPIFVTAIPWFLFLFSKQLQEILFQDGSFLWAIFGFIYFFALTTSVVLHFREKAWAAFHIEIIQDIIAEENTV
ncbi:hypothetical protein [Bacillus sp. Marseille-P3661]|uniref:hypothetical protein n=1 Tax=Bacillus sp. Marseille-P3661 TaxID=1936234 RepID=UPI000C831830|nr:hypothetical protein [Bacillus sp. Marseille-P3661]